MKEVWKRIPGFAAYEVSNLGKVRNLKLNIISQHKCKTTVGSYLDVNISNDEGIRKKISVHRLVGLTFNDPPENFRELDIDHKDNNKHNNRSDNLKWCTRSYNVKEAYLTGANKYSHKVEMLDLDTKEIIKFNSFNEVGEYLNIGKKMGLNVTLGHRDKPYRDRYVFKLTSLNYVSNKHNIFDIYCLDLKKDVLHRFENLTQLDATTGYRSSTAAMHLRKARVKLYNGFLICKVEDIEELYIKKKEITPLQIKASIDWYKSRSNNKSPKGGEWLILDYRTEKTITVYTVSELMKELGSSNRSGELKKMEFKLYNGKSFKYSSTKQDFLDYSEAYISLSLKFNVNHGQPVRSKNLILNTTEDWVSLPYFAKSMGYENSNKATTKDIIKYFSKTYSFENINKLNAVNGFLVSEMTLDKTS